MDFFSFSLRSLQIHQVRGIFNVKNDWYAMHENSNLNLFYFIFFLNKTIYIFYLKNLTELR